jgi:hypothetical protein
MIALMGYDRFVETLGAELVHEDRFGKLWRKTLQGAPEPLVIVEVVNSTQELDGSYKKYFLPVHPELRPIYENTVGVFTYGNPQPLTAHAAVASTFGLYAKEYMPGIET